MVKAIISAMNVKVLRLAGFFGLAAPAFGFIMIAISILMSPWFSWTANALSDLGVEGPGSVIINSGLAMTAAIMMMFSTGLIEMTKGRLVGQVGGVLYFVACLFLIGIGIANETIKPYHLWVSVGFFVTLPLSVAVIGFFHFVNGMRFYAILAWGTAFLASGVWFLHWTSAAIPETLSVASLGVWQLLLSWWMWTMEEVSQG